MIPNHQSPFHLSTFIDPTFPLFSFPVSFLGHLFCNRAPLLSIIYYSPTSTSTSFNCQLFSYLPIYRTCSPFLYLIVSSSILSNPILPLFIIFYHLDSKSLFLSTNPHLLIHPFLSSPIYQNPFS